MTKMIKRSAKVLDEADRFEDILNWQLFAQEQTHRLFDAHMENEHGVCLTWRPGDHIECFPGCYVRPMFDLYEENDSLWVGEDSDEILERAEQYCPECDVRWTARGVEDIVCWWCGQYQLDYELANYSVMAQFLEIVPVVYDEAQTLVLRVRLM